VIAALARPPLARLLRSPRARLALIGWCGLAIAFAVTGRSSGRSHAADHVLLGAYGPLVLPLLTYLLVGAILGAQSLSASAAPIVAFGARPPYVAGVAVMVAAAACALCAGILAGLVDIIAHGPTDPPLGRDAIASAYACSLGATAYAAWFSLGASLGKRGTGRPVFLVVDWLLGASDGAAALVTPRGHVRNLLGGTPPMDLSERASAAALVVLSVVCAWIAVKRVR
jgi:hypothetical protein